MDAIIAIGWGMTDVGFCYCWVSFVRNSLAEFVTGSKAKRQKTWICKGRVGGKTEVGEVL